MSLTIATRYAAAIHCIYLLLYVALSIFSAKILHKKLKVDLRKHPEPPLLTNYFSVLLLAIYYINPHYKHIPMIYWSARLSCCLQKSIAKSLPRKCSASNGLAAKGLHFSHPQRELSIERDLTLLSMYWCDCMCLRRAMIVILVRRTRIVLPPLAN